MKNMIITVSVLAGMLTLQGYAIAEEHHEGHEGHGHHAEKKSQTTCPVSGKEIKKDLFVEHKGERLYVCCNSCLVKVKKRPGRYVKKLKAEGITLEKVQTKCAVMGGKIKNKKLYADHDGKRIYFCCGMCPKKFNKDPEKYIEKLEDESVVLERTPGKKDDKGHDHSGHDH